MVTVDDFKKEIDKYPVKHYQLQLYRDEDRTWFIDAEVRTCYATKIEFLCNGDCIISLADHLDTYYDSDSKEYIINYCQSIDYQVTDNGFKSFKIHLKELYGQYKKYIKMNKEIKIKKKLSRIEKDFA